MTGINNLYQAQELSNFIFDLAFIKCETTFSYVPMENAWHCHFKTNFKYLSLTEKAILNREFTFGYEDVTTFIRKIRDKILDEYKYYFNPLWC